MNIERRIELIAFTTLLDYYTSPNLWDTLRPCIKAFSRWQGWKSPYVKAARQPDHIFEYAHKDMGYILNAMAVTYDLIYDRMTSYEKMNFQNAILALGIGQLYQGIEVAALKNNNRWYKSRRGAIMVSALGIACMALDDALVLPKILDKVKWEYVERIIDDPTCIPDPEGITPEGMSYCLELFQRITRLAEVFKNVKGDPFLYNKPYLRNFTHNFLYTANSAFTLAIPFGDVYERYERAGINFNLLYILTRYYNDNLGQWLLSRLIDYDEGHLHRTDGWPNSHLPQFVHYSRIDTLRPHNWFPTVRYFKPLGWAMARTNWDDTALMIAFKCASWDQGHGYHHDNNNFVLGRENSWLITDRGYRIHDDGRAHSVLSVDTCQQDTIFRYNPDIRQFDEYGEGDTYYIHMKGDASSNYGFLIGDKPALSLWMRDIVLAGKASPFLVIFDEIRAEASRRIDWRLRTIAEGVTGGDSILITSGNQNLLVKFLLPETFQILRDGDYSVYVARKETSQVNYLTVLFPFDVGNTHPPIAKIEGGLIGGTGIINALYGAEVGDKVVMFREGFYSLPTMVYPLERQAPESVSNFLVNLFPNTAHTVLVKDSTGNFVLINTYNSTPQGCLHFIIEVSGRDSIFITSEPLASSKGTYPNQGRHLVRTPNMVDCDWVYTSIDNKTVWQWGGENCIGPPFILGSGKYPSIAKNQPIFPWVLHTTGNALEYFFRRYDMSWGKKVISQADEIGPPSLVLSQIASAIPEEREIGYAVYEVKSFWEGRNYIYFTAFDSLGVYYTAALDTGEIPNGSAVYTPSIAITPGDYLHLVWQKEGRVWYKTTLEPVYPDLIRRGAEPVWSEKFPVSFVPGYPTEPASNPFVEAEGEWVYAVWRGPNEEGNQDYGEVWQRRGRIRPDSLPYWDPPRNMSISPLRESNYPTMSTGKAVVYQESLPGNREIYANILGDTVNISQTENNSFYPHTNLLPAPPYIPYEWELFNIWTEELVPETLYKVIFKPYYFQPRIISNPAVDVACGESQISPYCLNRDGFIDFGGLSIDYDNSNLIYRLPYLHPKKYYLLEAVVYQDTTGIHRERFEFENGGGKTIEFYPSDPETLRVVIPPGTYDNTVTSVEIRKLLGEFSALADLRLYEFEIADKEMGGPQDWWIDEIPPKTSLLSPYPNPFLKTLKIKYQLSKEGRVLIKVYDIAGREVRVLMNEKKEPGIYTVNFDGKDAKGRRFPLGVYFIRLKTKDFSETKKVVLMR